MSRTVLVVVTILMAGTVFLAAVPTPLRALWPPLAALLVILATRRALTGLLVGGYLGAVMLAGGDPWHAYLAVFADHLAPSLTSPWKVGAVAFTLVLGGFAAVLDATGGFESLLRRLAAPGRDAPRRFQLAALGLGLICFFDGLANSLMVGRIGRGLADRCGVARVKLAYIVDSTSSAVACVALVSTWIAYQLAMIEEGFALAGRDVNPYAEFLRSLPYNFHCWFTLVLVTAAAIWNYAPGPMGQFERQARSQQRPAPEATGGRPVAAAIVPLIALLLAFIGGFLVLGDGGPIWPPTREALVAAFGSDAGPLVMVLAGLVATLVGAVSLAGSPTTRAAAASRAFGTGVQTMIGPVFILVAAWILSSVMQAAGTADLIAGLVERTRAPALVPVATFVTGALVSFASGTSWGTMGLLFPLAIPAAAALGVETDGGLLAATVAAVFSGAVFGDHCSPFSDTTIVTSIACEIEPHDHVRTQIPYALITAAVAALVGFVPAGLGLAPGWSLAAGTAVLVGIARWGAERKVSAVEPPRAPSGSGGPDD
jgi:Na+/H+ antiporter NhaC